MMLDSNVGGTPEKIWGIWLNPGRRLHRRITKQKAGKGLLCALGHVCRSEPVMIYEIAPQQLFWKKSKPKLQKFFDYTQ